MEAVKTAHTRALRESVKISLSDLVQELRTTLGTPFVAEIANVDRKTVSRWCTSDEDVAMRPASEKHLRAAFQVFQMLTAAGDAPATVRGWFMGMNPQLDDDSPIEALSEGRTREVMAAARAFASGA